MPTLPMYKSMLRLQSGVLYLSSNDVIPCFPWAELDSKLHMRQDEERQKRQEPSTGSQRLSPSDFNAGEALPGFVAEQTKMESGIGTSPELSSTFDTSLRVCVIVSGARSKRFSGMALEPWPTSCLSPTMPHISN